MPVVPVITTDRLVLRAHRRADLDACFAMWGDPEVVRHVGGRPSSREETWWKILRYAGLWPMVGYGYWAIEERATGRFVGDIGFADFARDLDPPLGDKPEIGWALLASAQGRGFATEAGHAALAWIDAERAPARTVALVDPENAVSLRVAAKLGYRETMRAKYRGFDEIVLERARS